MQLREAPEVIENRLDSAFATTPENNGDDRRDMTEHADRQQEDLTNVHSE